MSALLLPTQDLRAQATCDQGLAGLIKINPTLAHLGDTIQFQVAGGGNGGTCVLTNVNVYLVYPDNTTRQIAAMGGNNLLGGACVACGTQGRASCTFNEDTTICLFPSTSTVWNYTIHANDLHNTIDFTSPKGVSCGSRTAASNQVLFEVLADGDNITGNQGTAPGGCTPQAVTVIQPAISITKQCVTNCQPPLSPGAAPFGSPINFSGTIKNTGDTTLTGVNATDSPPATIIFSTTTSFVTNTFPANGNGTLLPGESVNYTGSYQPGGNGCGPFRDDITALGTDQLGLTVTATTNANCFVCTLPCIKVTKACTNAVAPGAPITFGGYATNCGDVPLTNVFIVDVADGITNLSIGPITLGINRGVDDTRTYSGSYNPVNPCGGTNFVFASGNNLCTGIQVHDSTNTPCTITPNPCIRITKVCSPTTICVDQSTLPRDFTETFSGTVTNCGDITLTNVTVTDAGRVLLGPITLTKGGTPGSSADYSTNVTVHYTVADCGKTRTNTAVACGQDVCFHNTYCASNSCTYSLQCAQICVTKQVACYLGPVLGCGTFSDHASAVQATNDNVAEFPEFCYHITVTNCGGATLTQVAVNDSIYGNLSSQFPSNPTTLQPGQGFDIMFREPITNNLGNTVLNVTNVVTGTGVCVTNTSTGQGITVSANASAVATVVPAGLVCNKYYTVDGTNYPNNGSVCIADTGPHTIIWYVAITNTGVATLVHSTITDVGLTCAPGGVGVHQDLFCLLPLTSTNIALCTNTFICTNSSSGIDNTITIESDQFTLGDCTNALLCSTLPNGSNAVANTTCSAMVKCCISQQVFCRVTGGGRQDYDPMLKDVDTVSVCPPDVRYVTHGGQVGAPYGNGTTNCPDQGTGIPCSPADVVNQTLIVDNIIGNVCIHGRWTHVRHVQGGLEGNFHARFFDTLDCSCLSTQLDTCGLYGDGNTSIPGTCNPGDRSAGPEPRRAPANKIVFTGVGDWADPNGRRTPRSVLFRVDIEDRGEPGNDHALDRNGKPNRFPDRYRIRIWVLTPEECAQLHSLSVGPDGGLLHFRSAIAACYGIKLRDGVQSQFFNNTCADTGTGGMFFGGCGEPRGRCVRLPDIDDGGELLHGNHQIHPTIKPCDPTNPQGPGLANSGSDCSNQ